MLDTFNLSLLNRHIQSSLLTTRHPSHIYIRSSNQLFDQTNQSLFCSHEQWCLMMILALDVRIDLEPLYQPCRQLYVPTLTSHIQRSFFTNGRLIELKTLGHKELDYLLIIG